MSGGIGDLTVGEDLTFTFGKVHVRFDAYDRLQLSNGCFDDTPVIEKSDCPTVVAGGKTLKLNTLI